MKTKFYSLALLMMSALFMVSCSSSNDEPTPDPNQRANEAILKKMQDNYYWNVTTNTSTSLDPISFFNALVNPDDKYTFQGKQYRYSSIYEKSTVSGIRYDIGFEYSANVYIDGVYYVIDYVKPNTPAAAAGLKRGFLIESVNGTTVNQTNKDELLPKAIANSGGAAIKMLIGDPKTNTDGEFSVTPVAGYQENPVLLSQIMDVGAEKLGYLVYTAFNSNYDNNLNNALKTFANVDYLVLDLRYNAGGNQLSAQLLGKAIVTNKRDEDPFIKVDKRAGLEDLTFNFGNAAVTPLTKLKKVYIIVGTSTIGMPEVFVNALKPYLNANLVLVGEPTQGRNMAVGFDESVSPYVMNIVLGKWADKNLTSFGVIDPTIRVANPAILEPLGSTDEAMLAAVISSITGKSIRAFSANETVTTVNSSILMKANENLTSIVME